MKNRMMIFVFLMSLLFYSSSFAELPISRQATLLEASSASELYLESTGFYYTHKRFRKKADVKKKGIKHAIIDAKKAAIYFLLYGGGDPILSTDKELNHFKFIENDFFKMSHIEQYITYEDVIQKTVLLDRGTGIKVILNLKVDKARLLKTLENEGVIVAKETLLDLVGNPFIMVIPQLKKDQTITDALAKSENNKHAAGVIQSYLTAKQYDVLVPDQKNYVDTLSQQQLSLVGSTDDTSYQLALSIGSDVYIDYSVSFNKSSYDTTQAAVSIRAFETTTARLLGAETGYSEPRQGDSPVSIEEAILDAMNNIMNRIHNYWERDLDKGVQYKIITTFPTELDHSEKESLTDHYFDTLDDVSETLKETTSGTHTIDSTIWVSPKKYKNSRTLYQGIRESFKSKSDYYTLKKDHQNRKLLLLSISNK